jgi:hypothetical protein
MRQFGLAAAQHLLSPFLRPFLSLFFGVKFVYDYGLCPFSEDNDTYIVAHALHMMHC